MSLTIKIDSSLKSLEYLDVSSYENAKKSQSNWIWQQLEKITVQEAIEVWLPTLSERIKSNYRSGVRRLSELGLFDPLMTLQAFTLVNHEAIIDQTKWTKGIIPRALANREGHGKTFYKVYNKVKMAAMSQAQWCFRGAGKDKSQGALDCENHASRRETGE